MKIKNMFIICVIMLISLVGVYADFYEENFTEKPIYRTSMSSSDIDIQQLKYEPYPVNPGEYFTLWIKAENVGTASAGNAVFELDALFPFSLDPNENPVRNYGNLDSRPIVLEYKVRVSKDAVEGTNQIKLRYNTEGYTSYWIEETFDIIVADAQTDFDLVIQEVSGDEVSVAIANTGKNVAYSVIVRVPEQDYFDTVGTSGQMVGNLEDGDYTLVSFDITPKQGQKANGEKFLEFQIDYTDNIGERRSVIKEVIYETDPFDLSDGITGDQSNSQRMKGTPQTQKEIYQEWWFWIAIAAAFIVWKLYKFYNYKKDIKEEKRTKK